MPPTIHDVAQRAGVSKATVSYVLNGRETRIKITERTRNRIYDAARELNYHPNALARGLAQARTETVTLVMQYARIFSGWSGFTNQMMRGASEAAFQAGYDLMLHTKEQSCLDQEVAALTDGRADGALLLRDADDPLAERLLERGFPAVLMFTNSDHPDVWQVDCDNVTGGYLATNYLLELGHRRIMHLAGVPRSASARDRKLGYERALRDAGIALRPDWCVEMPYGGASFDEVACALRQPDRPTALFAWSDDVAVAALTMARSVGLRVPVDLSVIGYDSTELCGYTNPTLTSMRQPIYEMAAKAFGLLVRQIRGEEVSERRIQFTPVLDERASCAHPPRETGGNS